MDAAGEQAIGVPQVEQALHRLYIAGGDARGDARGDERDARHGDPREPALRDEDRKKAREVAALLGELARFKRDKLLVDAAAGHAYVGLLAAELLGFQRLLVIEREPSRIERTRQAAARLSRPGALALELRAGDVGDPSLWPERPD